MTEEKNTKDERSATFKKLVSGISLDEREILLSKLKATKGAAIVMQVAKDDVKETKPLETKFQSESIFYRIYVWIRSFFSKKSATTIYNEDLLGDMARRVNHGHPGLIDNKNALLLSLFCAKIKELKSCAQFLQPYFSFIDDDAGKFYVFLSSLLAPEISDAIMRTSDPYNVPFDQTFHDSMRAQCVKSMEDILGNLTKDTKSELYTTIKSINWLKQFTELPFEHFLAQFTLLSSNSYSCPFLNAQADYNEFSKVLKEAPVISQGAMESLFLYPHKNNLMQGDGTDLDSALNDFVLKVKSCVGVIQVFINTVPVMAIGKLIFADYDWQASNIAGSEDWFIRYKEQWKKIFNERWNNYLHDKKKYELIGILQSAYGIREFPELPYRPWTRLWGGVQFHCEMTAGFLWWFAMNQYNEYATTLNAVILEGVFVNKENGSQMSEAVSAFCDANQQILTLVSSIEEHGTFGAIFSKCIEERMRTVRAQQTINNLINNTENTIRGLGKTFCNSTRDIDKVFGGILDEKKVSGYEGLQNFMTIKGAKNKRFRAEMVKTRAALNTARAIVAEIEPLDSGR